MLGVNSKADNELYQKLEKTDLLKKVGIKPKWKFW